MTLYKHFKDLYQVEVISESSELMHNWKNFLGLSAELNKAFSKMKHKKSLSYFETWWSIQGAQLQIRENYKKYGF